MCSAISRYLGSQRNSAFILELHLLSFKYYNHPQPLHHHHHHHHHHHRHLCSYHTTSSTSNPSSSEDFYVHFLNSCNSLKSLKEIHSHVTTTSCLVRYSPQLTSKLILKYSNFGDIASARSLFDEIIGIGFLRSNSFLWNTMIRAYTNAGHTFETLELYLRMRREGVGPNNYTFPFLLRSCASRSSPFEGKLVHGDAIKTGFDSDMFVQAALVDMYSKCGEIDNAQRVFDRMSKRDLVCWTAMITAYEKSERPQQSLNLFRQMQEDRLLTPDSVTTVSIASAVAQLGDTKTARSVHAHSIRNCFLGDVFLGNSIIAMYSKCGNIEEAHLVFNLMDERDVISWNSMLSGYNENGRASEALLLFDKMQVSGAKPNPVTALIVISSCAYLGSLYLGKKIHNLITSSRLEIDVTLQNAIMDMYSKCGDLDVAVHMFNTIPPSERNSSSWNVMISGHGMHGRGERATQLFYQMQEEGVQPNHITFTSVLAACSHSGLVNEGIKCFEHMKETSVMPEMKHYTCMVDMLGRAGFLDKAFDLIKKMPLEANDSVWGALLLACRIHGHTQMGEIAAQNLYKLAPEHTGYYVLMSNIYAASSKWQQVGSLRECMKSRGLKKPAAFSVTEFGEEVHGFHTADQTHPLRGEVHKMVEKLSIKMKMAGYIPDLSCVLHDVEEEDKEHILYTHSEKLAVAFIIMKMEDSTIPIQVTNNLRICQDCHSAFKFISFIYGRKIVVRDVNRFHHFQGGSCSCNDYW